ncbi:hypothetical protein GCM10023108_09420 [Saccharopolyspora hordei]
MFGLHLGALVLINLLIAGSAPVPLPLLTRALPSRSAGTGWAPRDQDDTASGEESKGREVSGGCGPTAPIGWLLKDSSHRSRSRSAERSGFSSFTSLPVNVQRPTAPSR